MSGENENKLAFVSDKRYSEELSLVIRCLLKLAEEETLDDNDKCMLYELLDTLEE